MCTHLSREGKLGEKSLKSMEEEGVGQRAKECPRVAYMYKCPTVGASERVHDLPANRKAVTARKYMYLYRICDTSNRFLTA